MVGVISTMLYFFIVFICFSLSKSYVTINKGQEKSSHKLSITLIFVFSILFTLFNVFCTSNEFEWRGDRLQYYIDYNGREIESNLSFIINFIKSNFDSFRLLLYSTTFICCLFFFFAYRNSLYANSYMLTIFLLTDTILYSYTRLKQAYAIAIAAILFSILLKKNTSLKTILISLMLLYILCGFHVSGYIMIPLFIFIIFYKKKNVNIYMIFFIVIISFISFQPILKAISDFIFPFIPRLSQKINEYFSGDQLNIGDGSFIYFIKGLPYYFFLVTGIAYRKKFFCKIENYDLYLLILLCCSLSFVISLWSYWLRRTSAYFCFTSIEFGVELISNFENEKVKKFSYVGVAMFFGVLLIRYFYQSFSNYGCLI